MSDVDILIKNQVIGLKPFKLKVSRYLPSGKLQLSLSNPKDRDIILSGDISVDVSRESGQSCRKTLTELQQLLYTSPKYQERVGCWIHGDDCRAVILECEPQVHSSHTTTGQSQEFQNGGSRHEEQHYSGNCTMTIKWEYQAKYCTETKKMMTEPAIIIRVASNYTKFMWNPKSLKK